jgi:hypothetical protein
VIVLDAVLVADPIRPVGDEDEDEDDHEDGARGSDGRNLVRGGWAW